MATVEQLIFLESLYSGLARVLASPGPIGLPAWMANPGLEWPIYDETARLATNSENWKQAKAAISKVEASTLSMIQNEYEQLFVGLTRPPIWLYEAYYADGRILGPTSFEVSTLYTQHGLEVEGSELPDHASVELSFLAYLARQQSLAPYSAQASNWEAARKLFIKEHAGVWLTGVGKALVNSDYPAWTAIGFLLIASLSENKTAHEVRRVPARLPKDIIPHIEKAEECILCGFCVQVCPTHALAVREDRQTTALWLSVPACIHCQKCMHVCPPHVIDMVEIKPDSRLRIENQSRPGTSEAQAGQLFLLSESPRSTCPKCGEPTVSRAEMNYVIQQIGHPAWLDYCSNCRVTA